MASRIEKGALTNWWWTIDLWLIAGFGILFVAGIVIDMAASPPVAARLGLPTFHFVNRQIGYLAVTIAVAFLVSLASPRAVRRTALVLYIVSMALVCATLVYGAEVKGARRWISIAGIGIQPSEFAKPAFVILTAWLFSEAAQRKGVPAAILGLALLPATLVPLILQPDIGQTMLISVVWATIFFIAGLHIFWVGGPRRPRRGRRDARLFVRAACDGAHRPLPQQGGRRHFPGRHRDGQRSFRAAGSGAGPAKAW